jgi:hypothetical protein
MVPEKSQTKPALDLWRTIFGDGEGYLCVAGGVRVGKKIPDFRQRFYWWPEQAEEAATWCLERSREGWEVYFCAHLLTGRERIKENAAPVRALYAEYDGAGLPDNPGLEPSIVVESSPGHYHAYWLLTRPLEPGEAENLNRRLASATGADPSGHDLTQLLRVPGTANHKYEDAPEVRLRSLTGRTHNPDDLAAFLPELSGEEEETLGVPTEADLADEPPVRLDERGLRVWRGEEPASKDDGTVQTGRTLFKIACVLAKAGASRRAIAEALAERDAALGFNKYAGRPKEYRRVAEKAVGRAAGEKGAAPAEVKTFDAKSLMGKKLPPLRWTVPGILPEGVSILAGKPKIGKSWIALDLCLGVAHGEQVFRSVEVERGAVLYLALEDNERRLQRRIGKLMAGGGALRPMWVPDNFEIATCWPRIGEGGEAKLRDWLNAHPGARLVVIDTLKKIRPKSNGNRGVYDVDYEALEPLLPIAAEYGVSILVVHHTRKMASDDAIEEISGSFGLSGGVDGLLVLRRQRGAPEAFLSVEGRDIEEPGEMALRWDDGFGCFTLKGDAADFRRSQERQELLRVLGEADEPLSATDLAVEAGRKPDSTRKLIRKMARDGEVVPVGKGSATKYTLPPGKKDSEDEDPMAAWSAAAVGDSPSSPSSPIGPSSPSSPREDRTDGS